MIEILVGHLLMLIGYVSYIVIADKAYKNSFVSPNKTQ